MVNPKWYVLVDTYTNTALEFLQLPDTWNDLAGMHDLTDAQLATIGEWSIPHRGFQFLSLQVARAFEVQSIDPVINVKRDEVSAWIRTMRDPLLSASDVYTVSDRWNGFDAVSQAKITKFRKALRDITEGDVFNLTWPIIPADLKVLKKMDLSVIPAPSDEFLQMFTINDPVLSIEEQREERCTRLTLFRDARKYGGIKVDVDGITQWFWNDEAARNQYALLDGMVRRNNLPSSFVIGDWKTMTGEMIPMTVELLYRIVDTGILVEQELFRVTEEHRHAIKESLDPTSYDFKLDVPPTFEDEKAQFKIFE